MKKPSKRLLTREGKVALQSISLHIIQGEYFKIMMKIKLKIMFCFLKAIHTWTDSLTTCANDITVFQQLQGIYGGDRGGVTIEMRSLWCNMMSFPSFETSIVKFTTTTWILRENCLLSCKCEWFLCRMVNKLKLNNVDVWMVTWNKPKATAKNCLNAATILEYFTNCFQIFNISEFHLSHWNAMSKIQQK